MTSTQLEWRIAHVKFPIQFVEASGKIRARPITAKMLHTSQEKADKWFGGGRFWQIPGDFYEQNETTLDAINRHLNELDLNCIGIWSCEYVYTIYNRRFDGIQIIPVFAAEVSEPSQIELKWDHAEFGWFTAKECDEKINFWGLRQGLLHTRQFVTENLNPPKEFKLF